MWKSITALAAGWFPLLRLPDQMYRTGGQGYGLFYYLQFLIVRKIESSNKNKWNVYGKDNDPIYYIHGSSYEWFSYCI